MTLEKRDGRFLGWHHVGQVGAGDTSDAIPIPPPMAGQRISVTVIAGTNNGTIQFTTSSDADVTAGTATWQDWAEGTNTGTKSDVLMGPVTGLRCTAATTTQATVTWEIVI